MSAKVGTNADQFCTIVPRRYIERPRDCPVQKESNKAFEAKSNFGQPRKLMRASALNRDRPATGRIAAVALLIVLLLGLSALASSPTMHQKVCPNANRPGHHCAVTDFAGGLAEAPVGAALGLAVVLVVLPALSLPEVLFPSTTLSRLSPSRAPPSAVSFAG